ncbi:MAG: hypothetical protein JWL77_2091 [Chthonomonadaceae bacterium]|nr:hypothetical protein [Chthonomonadaceae bacterium]
MKRSSWIILSLCIVLAGSLVTLYRLSQMGTGALSESQARAMVQTMQDAVAHKNVNTIMGYITTDNDAKIVNLRQDQLRLLLARAFRNVQDMRADVTDFNFEGGTSDTATAQFNLALVHDEAGLHSEDYRGQITLHLRRMEIPHLFGLYSAHEWRIVGAETTGVDPNTFGEY